MLRTRRRPSTRFRRHLAAPHLRRSILHPSAPGGFFLGAESKTGIVEGGELPYQPWARRESEGATQHMELDPTGHCH